VDRASAFETIKGLLVEQLGVEGDQVTDAASFADDLNADSLDLVELIMEMEDRFKVQIPDEDAENIRTVGDAVDYVVAHAPAP
jgi:acyl carrier protein